MTLRPEHHARVLLRNGSVYAPGVPGATALAYEGGSVSWIGDDAAAAHYADNADPIVDLAGALVTPAFVDAHVHLAQTGLAARGVDLGAASSKAQALDLIAAYAAGTDDSVLMGFGWDETTWTDPELFTGAELDRVVGARPAYMARRDVHSAVISSALLERGQQIRARVGWSDSGRVERDAHHEARTVFGALVSDRMRREAIRVALRTAAAAGIGAVHELGAPHLSQLADFDRIRAIRHAEPTITVFGYWGEQGSYDVAQEYQLLGLAGDLCVDGAIGSRTSALIEPYADEPASRGHLYLDRAEICAHVVGCTRAGLQAGFHVIGDRAVEIVLAGLRDAAEQLGRSVIVQARHRLEHVEMIAPLAIAQLAKLGVVASVQPAFDAAWGGADGMYSLRLGRARALAMNPLGSMAHAGIVLAFGSDTPVTPFDPWGGVRAAAWHQTLGQQLSVSAGFAAHTRGGWRAAGIDHGGVLATGEPATFAVWEVPGQLGVPGLPDLHPDLPLPRCWQTVVAGQTIHQAPGAPT